MSDWKILITDGLEADGQSLLRAAAQVDDREGISPESLAQILGEYDALIVRGRTRVTRPLLELAPRLTIVGRAGVGVDNIDLAAVAELAFGMLLALARRLPYADRTMKEGEWAKKSLQGIELSGKSLGVIGMGNIGSAVASRAAAFGMQTMGYDPLLDDNEIAHRGAQPVSLHELFECADFITLHVPLTEATRGLIDAAALACMKRGVYIVCTARGGIIDEAALLAALDAGHVAGAALDVFAQEPPGLTKLVEHERVIATPHIGAQTAEAQARAAVDIAHEVLRALRGEKLRWRVA
jgi:D-3-phosphoglycerate dehydrogenase